MTEAARCKDCHGATHEVLPQADTGAPTSRAKMAATCARCHADQALIAKRGIPVPQAYQLYQKSVHGRAVAAGKAAATCNNCHASHDILPKNDPKSLVYRVNIPTTCGQCHTTETRLFLESEHGVGVQRGNFRSPVCSDCHGGSRKGDRDIVRSPMEGGKLAIEELYRSEAFGNTYANPVVHEGHVTAFAGRCSRACGPRTASACGARASRVATA